MPIQTELGKAYEYACLNAIYTYLSINQGISIDQTRALTIARDYYNGSIQVVKMNMDLAANAAIRVILRLEPQLENPFSNIPLYLTIQEDATGISGDVRDVLCIRRQNQWEIGLSCKHNHTAVKHSRLSPTIDFGYSWFGISCSRNYFNQINPMFDLLKKMRENKLLWRDILGKEEQFYVPLLDAFVLELNTLDKLNPGIIPTRLLQYLLGSNDFYKIISLDNRSITQVQAFNLYGTLNRPAGNVQPQTRIPTLQMPTRFYDISYKMDSKNTIIITCDNGWSISMRIHNASSRVEPSLKFDVTLVGVPPTLYIHHEPW